MAEVVIVGAGFSGHTAALYLRELLRKDDVVTVISSRNKFVYHPLFSDVAAGRISFEKIIFPLAEIYARNRIKFIEGEVKSIFPDDNEIEYFENGRREKKRYDFLVIATGNRIEFGETKGFVTNGETLASLVSPGEIEKTKHAVNESIARMKKGEKKKFVVGSGHPQSTYHNASLSFIVNLHYRLLKEKIRDRAQLVYFSNEPALGDFGLRSPKVKRKGNIISTEIFLKKILNEHSIDFSIKKGVREISDDSIYYENYEGEFGEEKFDVAVLTPKTKGRELKFIGKNGEDVSPKLVNNEGYVLVDSFYNLSYEEILEKPDYLPGLYRNRNYKNIFAGGFAFALPAGITPPHVTKNGLNITLAPMISSTVSATIGRLIARNIAQFLREERMTHAQRLSEMLSLFTIQLGEEALLNVIYPVFPDFVKYPKEEGRDMFISEIEVGRAANWMRRIIHGTYIYKYKKRLGWKIIPE